MVTTPACPLTEPEISELLPEPATPVITHNTPNGRSTSTARRLWVDAARIGSVPLGSRMLALSWARSSRWRPVRVSLARSPATVPAKHTVPPYTPAPGPRSTT